ncbi:MULTISPECIES: MetQ/NlpA family ABC transporter substrate-binding protein [Exiguobacterium]|uniref:Lipoprotein n=1 Tax=Exiguobacterium aurantiacum TaxID=33987 RepID=A0ABY5FQI8_9BACL|nr:MetQ/NlpA family ABC transporter substrate-binding protein [Exiguobacterium aurantiacum]UTT43887.1 MetQ/NlpA family ABC transporter substrate-binding protein [Exiguobacterium aurantiacum]
MKSWKTVLGLTAASALTILAACGGDSESGSGDDKTLVVGASNVPHAEILEHVKDEYEEKGYKLEIKKFQDYVLPNKTLADGDIDANYFQHQPYLDLQMKDNKDYKFASAGGVHVEPIGIYSQDYKSLDELPDGGEIIMSSNVAEHGRMLTLLQNEGVITLADGKTTDATVADIVDNPKNLKFTMNVEAALLPQAYNNGEGDAVIINTNYAIDAGLSPLDDSIALEGEDSPYVNLIVTREGEEDDERVKALLEVLTTKETQDWILEEYEGAVIPVNN